MLKNTILLMFSICTFAYASEPANFLDLPLEELLKIKVNVPAALTALSPIEAPASVTVLTAESIRLSTARNIYDLLEIYVPGAFWMNHEEGPHPGIRGSISNRNYKFLLLVNGRVMNNKQFFGAKSELEQWDMRDIERIEIIRGPGSVTYGPGAVAGVIKITTHTGTSLSGTHVNLGYFNEYQSRQFSVSHGEQTDDVNFFNHLSIVDTKGAAARHFQVLGNGNAGFVGADILPASEALDYFADYQDEPQLKLHTDIDFLNGWRAWLRYTQQGSTWRGNEVKSNVDGELHNQQSLRDRQVVVTVENNSTLSDTFSLNSIVSVDSYDAERRGESVRDPDLDHALNMRTNYAEHELLLRSTLFWSPDDLTEIATGFEYSRDHYGIGWGDSKRDMRMGDGSDIVNGTDSNAIRAGNNGSADRNGTELFVGSGWSTDTVSAFAETNYSLHPQHKLLISGRADKNTYTDWLFSPRLALISTLADRHITKLIAQRSVRMNTAGQLYANDQNHQPSDTEALDSLEFIYTALPTSSVTTHLSIFANRLDVIAWQGDINATERVGELRLWGLEAELQYKWGDSLLGANYSYVKQQEWDMAAGVSSSGISYSDYNMEVGDNYQTGYGNDLNNWPNHAVKLYANLHLVDRWELHLNARYFSRMDGAHDGLTSLRRALVGTSDEAPAENAFARIESEGVYDAEFSLNALLRYNMTKKVAVDFYVHNLYGSNDNKRYAYDTGNDDSLPRRVRYTEEPRAYGIQLQYVF